jgi:hypothetical protein
MQKRIYIISKYLGPRGPGHNFHFKGYYHGKKVNTVQVGGGDFIIGEQYILALQEISVKERVLNASLIKSKMIFI